MPGFTKCRCLLSVTVSMMIVMMSAEGSRSTVSNRLKFSRVHCRHANEFGVMFSLLIVSAYARSMEAMYVRDVKDLSRVCFSKSALRKAGSEISGSGAQLSSKSTALMWMELKDDGEHWPSVRTVWYWLIPVKQVMSNTSPGKEREEVSAR